MQICLCFKSGYDVIQLVDLDDVTKFENYFDNQDNLQRLW